MARCASIRLIIHRSGALALRLGLGPAWMPVGALQQLQGLLDDHSFWAQGRSQADLCTMLSHSAAVISVWRGRRLVGFGRASSDGQIGRAHV